MNTVRHPKYLLLLLALGLALGPTVRAEDKPAPAAPPAPAEQAAPEQPAKPATSGVEAEESAATAVSADKPVEEAIEAAIEAAQEPFQSAEKEEKGEEHSHRSRHSGNNERVSFGSDSTLAAGEEAEAVVSIFGSSTSAGKVSDAVVSIMGSSRVTGGTVGDSVVSVLGNTYVNGHVKGEVVTVLGNLELGPEAVVEGEVVCVGGQIMRDAKAEVRGNVQNIAVAGRHFNFEGLTIWFQECLLYARPLAFHRGLFWAWTLAVGLLGFYALIALIASGGVVKCVETLEQRPGYSLLSALLTMLLTPVAFILLALTLFIAVGFVLIPALSLGLFFAALFGKIVMLAWLGRRFTKLLGEGPLAHPVYGVLIGGLIVLGLYTIPIVGFVTYKLLGILGLGVVVYTIIRHINANRPPKPLPTVPVVMAPAGVAAATVPAPDASGVVSPLVAPQVFEAPPMISAATMPRAGFWIRVGAAMLDFVLVFVLSLILLNGILNVSEGPGFNFLLWIVYHPIMWKMKGTTIGGIICGLKLVRLDDRPIDWGVAIVRTLGAFLSWVVAGLGFIWVAFDDEKQSWHDKVAGTTIVRVPKGTPLL